MEEYAAIYACETSTEGEVLLHDIGVMQKGAAPNMNWSPYMIVDGVSKYKYSLEPHILNTLHLQ